MRNITTFYIIALLTVCSMILALDHAEARKLIDSDDFTEPDGSNLDPDRWDIKIRDTDDDVRIINNTLRTILIDGGSAYAISLKEIDTGNFTVLIDWMVTKDSGRSGELRVVTHPNDTTFDRWIHVFYGDYHGWSNQMRVGGENPFNYSMITTMTPKTWYSWNLTVSYDSVNWTVTRKDNGAEVFNQTNITIDPIVDPVSIWFGSFGNEGHSLAGFWDNYRVYVNGYYPNEPPVWDDLPTFSAVEDVPLAVDLSTYVSDPDGNVLDLSITSTSPYVTDIDGLTLTFKFPDGVTSATVPLTLSDGEDQASIDVEFIIEPVYYPSQHNIPAVHAAEEDILYSFDTSSLIWDPDDRAEDLLLLIDDPYVTIDGQTFSALFPDGLLYYEVVMTLSDGMHSVPVDLMFIITPVNDPPEHDITSSHTALEDIPYVYDVAPFIWDIDDPTEDLSLQTDDPYVTIDGQALAALFPEGVLDHVVELTLSDGMFSIQVDLTFTILPVNDPPAIDPIAPFTVIEDQAAVYDITYYLHDVDTPLEDLEVTVDSANCMVVGRELHFLYYEGDITDIMFIQVKDPEHTVQQSLFVYVEERNDAPVVLALPPQNFNQNEETTIDLATFIMDEETPLHELTIVCNSPYVARIEDQTITLLFEDPEPEHTIQFFVSDGGLFTGGTIQAQVTAVIISEPPPVDDDPIVTAPVVGVVLFILIAALVSVEATKVGLLTLFLPLYSKLRKENILDQFTRGKIVGYIMANPGEHYNSIKKTLDISNGSFVYHLNLLENEGYIKSHRDGIYKRYYPSGMRVTEQANSLNKSQSLILEVVRENPGISQKDIAAFLGISPSTINYHVEKLIQMGMLEKERKGMSVRYYLITEEGSAT